MDHELDKLGWMAGARILEPADDIAIYVIKAELREPVRFRSEGPATFSLCIVLEGEGRFSIDGARPLEAGAGSAIVFASDGVAKGENDLPGGQHFHVVDIRFEPELLRRIGAGPLAHLGVNVLTEHSRPDEQIYLLGVAAPAALLQVARDISTCPLAEGVPRRLFLHSKAIEALSLTLSALQKPQSSASSLRPAARQKVTKARELLESRFHEAWTIASLSRAVGLNERQLKQGFRLLVGNSIHAHLRDVRLDAAASLLCEGQSVTEAALAVGFDSLSHFSKVFRAAKGVLPSQYARMSGE